MPRIVSVWLPRWPILRLLAAQARNPLARDPIDPQRPFVLAVDGAGGPRIAALNAAAEDFGLMAGDRLADARAKAGSLQVRAIDPAADDAALRRLALWATRYTPAVSPWGEENGADGFFLDVTGAAHLFGGEESLLADLAQRLERFGLPARLAVADTAGAAWALSRFHPSPAIIAPFRERSRGAGALADRGAAAFPDTRTTLRRLGFKRIGALIDQPRAPFAARFERELLKRLDQALGRAAEPLACIAPLPVYHSLRYLIEPVATQQAVVAIAARLMADIVHVLVRDGVGARALRLALYRVDGDVPALDIGLTLPTRNVAHVARLIDLKLERIVETSMPVSASRRWALPSSPPSAWRNSRRELAALSDGDHDEERCAALIDALASGSVRQRAAAQAGRQSSPRTRRGSCAPATAKRRSGRRRIEARPRPFSSCPMPSPRTSRPSCPRARPGAFAGAA